MPKKIFIISGPSGAGEDSIISELDYFFEFEKVISTTTRQIRPGEDHGKDYYFSTKEDFKRMIEAGEFFEWVVEDDDNYYGTTKKEIERIQKSDKVGIWKTEYKGAIKAKEILPGAISIFIHIPLELVERRLKKRDNYSQEFIQGRIEYAKGWYENQEKFDYTVNNIEGELDQTIEKVVKIIKNELAKPLD